MSVRHLLTSALVAWAFVIAAPTGAENPPAKPQEIGPSPGALTEKDDNAAGLALVEDLADGRLDSHTLSDAVLVASGVGDAAQLAEYRGRLEALLDEATARVNRRATAPRRARRLLHELHRVALRRYDISSDRFTELIDSGTYNCVSASLLYLIAARRVGLEAAAAETPLHVFVTLDAGGRHIDIEVTSPAGFDVRRDLAGFRTFVLANKYVTAEELARRGIEAIFNEFNNLKRPVSAESAVAFLYHNAGIRALQVGDAGTAARQLISAARIYPSLGYRSDDLRTTLAWSVRELYDAGDYAAAFEVAAVSMSLFPDRATVTDRFIAVSGRAVEDAAARGDLEAAERLESSALSHLTDVAARRKLEAYTAPVMARAALMARDWPAARRHAARFRAESVDTGEAERFAGWVEARIAEGGAGEAGALDDRVTAALADMPPAHDPWDYAAVLRAIAALAEHDRYDEALAVGKMQRAAIAAEGSPVAALDDLLRAVAGRRVAALLRGKRWKEAADAVADSLARWPGDLELVALQYQARSIMTQDPWRIGVWPETARLAGAAGRGMTGPKRDAPHAARRPTTLAHGSRTAVRSTGVGP